MQKTFSYIIAIGAMLVVPNVDAKVVTVDGTPATFTTLSAAVADAYAADDGPDIINIVTDSLGADGQVYINKPITINGDADGNGVSCDILVDIPLIRSQTALSTQPEKAYIALQTSDTVSISNLRIHPNEDGVSATDTVGDRVDGIRAYKPQAGEAGLYLLTKVYVSGSDASNKYVPLDTGADIYATTPKKWSSGTGVTIANNQPGHAAVQLTNAGGSGTYSAILDHCHVGLSKSSALNSPANFAGERTILGGVYGHCGADGIRVSGNNVTIKGTRNDRVRVLRSTSIRGGNANCIEVDANGKILLLEYVDIAGQATANLIKMNDNTGSNDFSRISIMKYVRGLGMFDDGAFAMMYLNGDSRIPDMQHCTIAGDGLEPNPIQTQTNFNGRLELKDSIFTSESFGRLILDNATGANFAITNCAFPTDNTVAESLTTTGSFIAGGSMTVTPSPVNTISVSPQYLLTLANYDWSDAQGANVPGNGPGNENVLRPSNPVYLTASSTAGPLYGGAGEPSASISSNIWMLLD